MTSRSFQSDERRGVALLLALVALALLPLTAVGALRAATSATVEERLRADQEEARSLALDLAHPLRAWASRNAARAHTGPEAERGGFRTIYVNAIDDVAIRVDAIDLSGRLHVSWLDSFAAQGLPAPLSALRARDFTADANGDQPQPPAPLEEIAMKAGRADGRSDFLAERDAVRATACWLTSHGAGSLNANSAPLELLRAALRGADPAAAGRILRARERGEAIPTEALAAVATSRRPAPASRSRQPRESRFMPITGASDAFGFVVAVAHGGVERRWWIVASQGTPPGRAAAQRDALFVSEAAEDGWSIAEFRRIDW